MNHSIKTLWYRREEMLKRIVDAEAEAEIPDNTPELPEYKHVEIPHTSVFSKAFAAQVYKSIAP